LLRYGIRTIELAISLVHRFYSRGNARIIVYIDDNSLQPRATQSGGRQGIYGFLSSGRRTAADEDSTRRDTSGESLGNAEADASVRARDEDDSGSHSDRYLVQLRQGYQAEILV